jgi:hypothetical protein
MLSIEYFPVPHFFLVSRAVGQFIAACLVLRVS